MVNLICEKGGYVLCPGLKPSFYEDKTAVVGYDREGVRVFTFPVKRYESSKCLLWHCPTNKRTKTGKIHTHVQTKGFTLLLRIVGHDLHDVCSECKKEAKRLTESAERAVLVSVEEKDERLNPTFKYPLAKLSPCSKVERINRLKRECAGFQQKLASLLKRLVS